MSHGKKSTYPINNDLRKSEVTERERMGRSWCHNYPFLMSLLLVSNDINHHGNFKHCENSKSHICYAARPNPASR